MFRLLSLLALAAAIQADSLLLPDLDPTSTFPEREAAARAWVLSSQTDLSPDAPGLQSLAWALARWTSTDPTGVRLSEKYTEILLERFSVWRGVDRALSERGLPASWSRAVSAHLAHRLCVWRLPDTQEQWLRWLEQLPPAGHEESVASPGAFEQLLANWLPPDGDDATRRAMVHALFSLNPHLAPLGFVRSASSTPPAPTEPGVNFRLPDGRIQRDRWHLEDATSIYVPPADWARRFLPPPIELESPTPRIERLYLQLPAALGGRQDLRVRLVMQDGGFALADLQMPGIPHPGWSLVPAPARFGARSSRRAIEPTTSSLLDAELLDGLAAEDNRTNDALLITNTRISGVLRGTLTSPWRSDDVELHLELDRKRGEGSFRLLGERGPLGQGEVRLAAPDAASDPVQGRWPSWLGEAGNGCGTDTPPLRDDPSQARPVWLADALIPDGRGPDTRGKVRRLAPGLATMGGWASPVVDQDLVVLSYYLPSGNALAYGADPAEGDLVRANRILADDVVHAFDLHTGQTRWMRRIPGGLNWGGFNKGGPQLSPATARGRVVSVGTTGRVFCHALDDGRELWRSTLGERHTMMERVRDALVAEKAMFSTRNDFQFNVVIADDVVVLSDQRRSKVDYRYEADCGLLGLDLETGRRLWHLPEVAGRYKDQQGAQLLTLQGKAYVLAPGEDGVHLIDPRRGEILWSCPELVLRGMSFALAGNLLVGDAPRKTDGPEFTGVVAIRMRPDGWEKAWSLPAPLGGRRGGGVLVHDVLFLQLSEPEMALHAIDPRDGRVLASEAASLASGEHCPFLISAGGRVLAPLDRTVGLVAFAADAKALPGSARTLRAPFATGYCGSLLPALADGRMFIRTQDRLMCLDLREGANEAPPIWTASTWSALFARPR